ncbi:DNA polymerase IV [Candidatus Daviesbacteria bacterium]|nr:DNA polymerase IV [Candidatus Daviesbacteria bacterium]
MRVILHIDFNSYFATVEQQANPRLRGKPIGITGGDRMKRTVLGAASVEAKRFGVKTGMQIWEAQKLCPQIILVSGDSDKYSETTKRFLTILKDYSPYLEVFSIDEAFLEMPSPVIPTKVGIYIDNYLYGSQIKSGMTKKRIASSLEDSFPAMTKNIALEIKRRIKSEIGEYITCSIGISYNKLMAKLAGSLQKLDGLVVIPDQETAIKVLDKIALDDICGIGSRIKKRLNNLGIFDFKTLRKAPLKALLASFKSYGQTLYNMARGIDYSPVVPFYEKEEVKSIGHRHTIDHDTDNLLEIKQILLKLTELIARKLRAKKLTAKTIHCWYREVDFESNGMQQTILWTSDGLEIFNAAWKIFNQIWSGEKIRMIGVSISNLKSQTPQNLSFLVEVKKREIITKALDQINNKYGEFTLQRGILLGSSSIWRQPNPFLSDRRFKI